MNVSNIKHNQGTEIQDYAKNRESNRSNEIIKRDDHASQPAATARAASDPVFLNNIRPAQAREFLHNNIGRSISDYAAKSQPGQSAFARSFPNAETTASQIIDTIGQAANTIPKTNPGNPASETQGKSLADLVNKIQDGFRQTKEALNQLGALSSGFAPEFDKIQERVNNFLQFLSDPENNTSQIASSYESYQRDSQARIQIETRDGDIVTIDLANSLNQQQSNSTIQSNNQNGDQNRRFSGYVYEAYSEAANSFSFTVSGNLDEGELKAINALVGDIAKTIGQFEKGNIDAALNIAKNIDTQSAELDSFSFNVQTSEQYRAIDLYQTTQTNPYVTTDNLAAPSPTTVSTSLTRPLSNNENVESIFSNNISNIIYAAESANILDPANTVNTIFEKFYAQLEAQNKKLESLMSLNENGKKAENQQEPSPLSL